MSFREKSAWISLLTYLAVYGYYFWTIAHVAASGQAGAFHYQRLLGALIVELAVVQIVLTIVVAALKPKEAQAVEDERERLILLKATRVAFHVVMIGAATCAAAIAYGAPPFYGANGAVMAVVLGQLTQDAGKIVYFRQGA